MRVLVTGASGFIGRALVNELATQGHQVRAAMRTPADIFARSVEVVAVSDLARPIEWRPLIRDIDAVVHLAGVAHAGPGIAEQVYDRVNRAATAGLAAAAAAARIKRLIFVSSVRAQSGPASPDVLTETTPPAPGDAYGRSKLAAETAIRASAVPHTILRPTLIYGEGVKGNLASLMQLARLPLPLPLASLRRRRSLLARENLITAIHFALGSDVTIGETYLVADPDPLTVADMVGALRAGFGRRPALFPMPTMLLAAPLKAIGRADVWERLAGQSVVDAGKLVAAGWRPTVETRAGLAAMANLASKAQAASPRKSGTASRSTL